MITINKRSTINASLAAIFAALTFVFIFYFNVPTGVGIVHIGDFFIYIAASLLPWPYAMLAGAVGAGLTNILNPALVPFLPFTLIIKPLNVIPFTSKKNKIICRRNVLAIFISGAITIVGYFIARVIIVDVAFAITGITFNVLQAVSSGIAFVLIGLALDAAKIKRTLRDRL